MSVSDCNNALPDIDTKKMLYVGNTMQNAPLAGVATYYIDVVGDRSNFTQVATCTYFQGSTKNVGRQYLRSYTNSTWSTWCELVKNSDFQTEKIKYMTKRLDNFSKTITYGYAEIGSPQSLGLPSGATLLNVMLDGWQSLNTGSISFGGNDNMIYVFSGTSTVTANYITLRLVYK